LLRSSGATLLFEFDLLWEVVLFGYFTSGLFRRSYDSKYIFIRLLFTCIVLLLSKKKEEKKEKKEEKKKKRNICE